MLTRKKRQFYFFAFTILFIILIPVIILLATGYRLDNHWKLTATGGIAIENIPADSQVFINYKQENTGLFSNRKTFFEQYLTPQSYFVVVAKEGYWSWAKHLTVEPKKVAVADALLVPQHPKLKSVEQFVKQESIINNFHFFVDQATTSSVETGASSDEPNSGAQVNNQYTIVSDAFATSFATSTITSDSRLDQNSKGNVSIWHNGKTIWAQWLGSQENIPSYFSGRTVAVYSSNKKISHIDFMPGRNDVILFTLPEGVYAIEMDKRPEQNLEPLYGTAGSDFRVIGDNTIFIEDAGHFFELEL